MLGQEEERQGRAKARHPRHPAPSSFTSRPEASKVAASGAGKGKGMQAWGGTGKSVSVQPLLGIEVIRNRTH